MIVVLKGPADCDDIGIQRGFITFISRITVQPYYLE